MHVMGIQEGRTGGRKVGREGKREGGDTLLAQPLPRNTQDQDPRSPDGGLLQARNHSQRTGERSSSTARNLHFTVLKTSTV